MQQQHARAVAAACHDATAIAGYDAACFGPASCGSRATQGVPRYRPRHGPIRSKAAGDYADTTCSAVVAAKALAVTFSARLCIGLIK